MSTHCFIGCESKNGDSSKAICFCEIEHEGFIESIRDYLKEFKSEDLAWDVVTRGDRPYIRNEAVDDTALHFCKTFGEMIRVAKSKDIPFAYAWFDGQWWFDSMNDQRWQPLFANNANYWAEDVEES